MPELSSQVAPGFMTSENCKYVCCLKVFSLGVVCYVAIDNEYSCLSRELKSESRPEKEPVMKTCYGRTFQTKSTVGIKTLRRV